MQNASSRLSERINWSTIQFLLENSVFLLIGLQVRWIVADVSRSDLGARQIVAVCLAVLATVVLLRPIWVFPVRFLAIRPGPDRAGRVPSWRSTAIISWAGMRGVVTLAAVFALPEDTPQREVLVLIAMVVTAGTLLLQGFSLPVAGPSARACTAPTRARTRCRRRPSCRQRCSAGLRAPRRVRRRDRRPDHGRAAPARRAAGQHRAGSGWAAATPRRRRRARRTGGCGCRCSRAERAEVLRIRDAGEADHEVLDQVMGALDLEESMLDRVERRDEAAREGLLLPPEPPGGACEHLRDAPTHVEAPDAPGLPGL